MKSDIDEGPPSKGAAQSPHGAGQYFTQRVWIGTMVEVMNLASDDTVCDPACGAAGFLPTAHEAAALARFTAGAAGLRRN